MQLFCLTAMEAPNAINADSVRGEKVKVLQATHLADINNLEKPPSAASIKPVG